MLGCDMGVQKLDYTGVAELLGVSRRNLVERISKRPDFPKPIVRISQRTVWWDPRDVLEWAKRTAKRGWGPDS